MHFYDRKPAKKYVVIGQNGFRSLVLVSGKIIHICHEKSVKIAPICGKVQKKECLGAFFYENIW